MVVKFQGPLGEKALRRTNLKLHLAAKSDVRFQIGEDVRAHSLGIVGLNNAHGTVVGHQGDSVIVKFQEPLGEKALKNENLVHFNTSSDDIFLFAPCCAPPFKPPPRLPLASFSDIFRTYSSC